MIYPQGFIVQTKDPLDSFLVYGDISIKGFASKGWRFYAPNLAHASVEQQNELYMALVAYFARQGNTFKTFQIKFERDSDYSEILDYYDEMTEKYARTPFPQQTRQGISEMYRLKMQRHELKRDYLYFYVTVPLKGFLPPFFSPSSKRDIELFEKQLKSFFDNEFISLRQSFSFMIRPMDHIDLAKHFDRSANKSSIDRKCDYAHNYRNRFEQYYENEYSGHTEVLRTKAVCMTGDGYVHNFLTVDRLSTCPDIIPFFGNGFLADSIENYSITVNLKPIETQKLVMDWQQSLKRSRLDLKANPSEVAYEAQVDNLEGAIYRLGAGEDVPYKMEMIFHIWNKNVEILQADTSCLRQIGITLQMPLYMHELGSQSIAQFLKTFPGNTGYPMWREALTAFHRSFCALIPMSGSYVGLDQDFQALFEGDHNNLVCINPFFNGTPQHTAMFGQTGSGKSVNTLGILLQIYPFYKKIVIIEEGASYLMFTRILRGEFLEIDVNSNMCLNYFDTCGVPLSASQSSFVTNFLVAMCGVSDDPEIIQDRSAMLSYYVARAYDTCYLEWKNAHLTEMPGIARRCMTIEWMLPNQPSGRATALDCYFDLQEALGKDENERNTVECDIVKYHDSISEMSVNEYVMGGSDLLRDISYAFMKREEMPYHSQLVEMIRSTPESFHKREDTDRIATRLAQYSIESGRGGIFDGFTNIDLSNRLIHFELGKMAQADANFKAMIGLVIGNLVKNQITNMPRTDLKMYIFEEAQRFLTIPGGAAIMMQSYAQFRKFNCVAWTITQEAGQLMTGDEKNGSDVGTIVMGQSKQYYFLKNKDKNNLEQFGKYVRLPQDTCEAIMNFPSPESISGGRKYSSFVYYVDNGAYPIIGVVRHYASALTVAVASTNGKAFTHREDELRKLKILHPDLSYGELLLLFIKQEQLDNPALRLAKDIKKNKSFGKLDLLIEQISDLSIKLVNATQN